MSTVYWYNCVAAHPQIEILKTNMLNRMLREQFDDTRFKEILNSNAYLLQHSFLTKPDSTSTVDAISTKPLLQKILSVLQDSVSLWLLFCNTVADEHRPFRIAVFFQPVGVDQSQRFVVRTLQNPIQKQRTIAHRSITFGWVTEQCRTSKIDLLVGPKPVDDRWVSMD